MKHLIGVITYKMTKSLELTVKLLNEDIDFVILVDKKTDINNYKSIAHLVNFISDRHIIKWGDYSQILAMIKLINYSAENNYDYLSIISESDLPLIDAKKMNEFITHNKGLDFIGFVPYDKIYEERIIYRYFDFYKKRGSFLRLIFKKTKLFKLFKNKDIREIPKIYKGSNWFTISKGTIAYIQKFLRDNPDYYESYKYSYCADEIFFHTILMNSNRKNNIYQFSNLELSDSEAGLRYVDWESGPIYPAVLQAEDILEYKKISPKSFFFRKISENSNFEEYLEKFKKVK